MQNKPDQNTASDPDTVPSEALRVCAKTGLAQRQLTSSETEVQRMARTLLRLQPAALSAGAATANVQPAANFSPLAMSQTFAHTLKTLVV